MANVLFVDADEHRSRLTAWALEPEHVVQMTDSLQAAATLRRQTKVDVFIYNTLLDKDDKSNEILRAIAGGTNEPPRVIAVEERGATHSRAIGASVDAVITSPFDAEDLLITLNDVLLKTYE
jgi:DNA-binding response OmpR family regulator